MMLHIRYKQLKKEIDFRDYHFIIKRIDIFFVPAGKPVAFLFFS